MTFPKSFVFAYALAISKNAKNIPKSLIKSNTGESYSHGPFLLTDIACDFFGHESDI